MLAEGALRAGGFDGEFMIVQSNGGVMSPSLPLAVAFEASATATAPRMSDTCTIGALPASAGSRSSPGLDAPK